MRRLGRLDFVRLTTWKLHNATGICFRSNRRGSVGHSKCFAGVVRGRWICGPHDFDGRGGSGRTYKLSNAKLSEHQATCFPYAVQTMHDAIVTIGQLRPGDSVLIQGASSAVGLLGMQIAKLKGAYLVFGTSGTESRRNRLREFGCDVALDSKDPSWPEQVKSATNGKGVNLIIDQVSAGVAKGNMEAAAVLGRIVNVGRLGGMEGDFDFDLHAVKRITYVGVTFRTRSIEEYRAIVRAARADLWAGVETGTLQMPIDRVFPLERAPSAFTHMSAIAHMGKIVLGV